MTATTDLVPDVLDYLVTQCQASAALQALGVIVFDGPPPTADVQGVEQCLWIGCDPKSFSDAIGSEEQEFAFLGDGGATRNETGRVTLAAKHWTGDTAIKPHRDGCKAIRGVVELMLRGMPSKGGPGDTTMGGLAFWSACTKATWYQQQVDGGAEAVAVFDVEFFSRLTSS